MRRPTGRDRRLTKPSEFAAARRQGRSWSDRFLVLIARPNNLEVTRYGFSVGKRVGKAVVRNKIRRRLGEASRLIGVRQGWDIVIIPRKDASSADFRMLGHSMNALLARARVLDVTPRQIRSSPGVQ